MRDDDSIAMDNVPRLAGHRRTYSANLLALAWTQSWQGLQMGERLQANAISERQIRMIALGGVIGTGLFLGSATALRHAGPAGTLIGYSITGSMVLCVTKSLAQMVSCFPRSGGPVGLSHLYVDPALAFALGWNAWYNWTIIIPAEIAAAGVLMNTFFPTFVEGSKRQDTSNIAWTVGLIVVALLINLAGSKIYGKLETRFSILKMLTIFTALLSGVVLAFIDRPTGRIAFRFWRDPGAFNTYRYPGARGRLFGIWTVLIQACFSYFGTEVTVMAVAEVKNPKISIPKAARGIWIRISCFYVFGVFVAGLLVPFNDKRLGPASQGKTGEAFKSPFVIGFLDYDNGRNHARIGAYVFAALFVMSALSAAISDIFISSRFLFFMSKCGHAPRWCSHVWKGGRRLGIVPYAGVAVAGAFATLAFMTAADAEQAFHWLSTMTSTAALCSWIGMMWTYVTWIRGLKTARRDPRFNEFFKKYEKHIPPLHWYHEPRAWYALAICILILLLNGWAVFTVPGPWIVARVPGQPIPPIDADIGPPVPTFVSSYLPVPFFLLLVFGYKLINRTTTVTTETMVENMALEWDEADRESTAAPQTPQTGPSLRTEQSTKLSLRTMLSKTYKTFREIL